MRGSKRTFSAQYSFSLDSPSPSSSKKKFTMILGRILQPCCECQYKHSMSMSFKMYCKRLTDGRYIFFDVCSGRLFELSSPPLRQIGREKIKTSSTLLSSFSSPGTSKTLRTLSYPTDSTQWHFRLLRSRQQQPCL